MRAVVPILLCLTLTSCALFAEAGAGLAAEEALVSVGARAAVAESAMATSRLMIAPEVASAARGSLGVAMEELAAGRGVLLVDELGVIRAGSRSVASLSGDTLYIGNRAVGYLRGGELYRMEGGSAVGRLHGSLPARDVWLTFRDGFSAPSLRPMFVDVLRFENGRYLVRLADGSEAWIPAAAMMGLAVLAAGETGECDASRGVGVLVRPSGEPISFSHCWRLDDALVLETPNGTVVVAPDEVQEIIYGSSEVQFADALMSRTRS